MSFSDYTENKVLGHFFGGVSYTAPATLYVGLFTAAPSDAGGGTEVSGGSYARVAVTTSTGMLVSGTSPTQVVNGVTITFPTATAGWGTVVAAGFFDAASGGNLMQSGTLSVSKTVTTNDILQFTPSSFKITLD